MDFDVLRRARDYIANNENHEVDMYMWFGLRLRVDDKDPLEVPLQNLWRVAPRGGEDGVNVCGTAGCLAGAVWASGPDARFRKGTATLEEARGALADLRNINNIQDLAAEELDLTLAQMSIFYLHEWPVTYQRAYEKSRKAGTLLLIDDILAGRVTYRRGSWVFDASLGKVATTPAPQE